MNTIWTEPVRKLTEKKKIVQKITGWSDWSLSLIFDERDLERRLKKYCDYNKIDFSQYESLF